MTRGPYVGRGILGILVIIALGIVIAESVANGGSLPAVGSARLKVASVLGYNGHRYTTDTFRGGEVAVVMGGVEVDLREAVMAGDEAVLEVDVVMGKADLRIPDGWTVVSEVDEVLGAANIRRQDPDPGADTPTLILRGGVVMGELVVRR